MSRSEQMSMIRSSGSEIESVLRRELWKRGVRYRKNCRSVFGQPDLAFIGPKVAVFCDSAFWHGRDYLEGRVPQTNQGYWVPKLLGNIERDKNVNRKLASEGWLVLRFWDDEILGDVSAVADVIECTVKDRRQR